MRNNHCNSGFSVIFRNVNFFFLRINNDLVLPKHCYFENTDTATTDESMLLSGADKSLVRSGRKKATPVKIVMGRGMD